MLVGQPKLLKEVNRDIIKDMIFEEGHYKTGVGQGIQFEFADGE